MLAKRIIPCLDCDLGVRGGRVVKGVNFKNISYAGVPWELAEKYSNEGADEIVFLDITASSDRRGTMVEAIKRTSESVFVPLCVGGGVRAVGDFNKLLKAGADKCSINTSAIGNPKLVESASREFGSQCVVLAIDAKRRYDGLEGKKTVETNLGECWFECSTYGGRRFTGMDAIQWAIEAERRGAGEILLTSMDADGKNTGYDLELVRAVADSVNMPVIASGGAGSPEDIADVLEKTNATAALAASIFHYGKYSIAEVKAQASKRGIRVRT